MKQFKGILPEEYSHPSRQGQYSMRDDLFKKASTARFGNKKRTFSEVDLSKDYVNNVSLTSSKESLIETPTISRKTMDRESDYQKVSGKVQGQMQFDSNGMLVGIAKVSPKGFRFKIPGLRLDESNVDCNAQFPRIIGRIESVDDIESDKEEEYALEPLANTESTNEVTIFVNSQNHILGELNGETVQVPEPIYAKLFDYQKDGVKFLFSLFAQKRGGILADDMGMGKTIQIISFISALKSASSNDMEDYFNMPMVEERSCSKIIQFPVLIVTPASVLLHWQKEFYRWVKLKVYIAMGKEKDSVLSQAKINKLDVVLISYDTFKATFTDINDIQWSCMIYDEVHKVKNRTSQLSKLCKQLRIKLRYGLTGTVMQNSFEELWNICDILGCASSAFGDLIYFKRQYASPIIDGHIPEATPAQVQRARIASLSLAEKLKKFTLRRTKSRFALKDLPSKEDHVVFCSMTPTQVTIYQKVLESPFFKFLRDSSLLASPCSCDSGIPMKRCCRKDELSLPVQINWKKVMLPAIVKLQQLANHIALSVKTFDKVDGDIKKMLNLDESHQDDVFLKKLLGTDYSLVRDIISREDDFEMSGKLRVLNNLLPKWHEEDSKVLLFSSSTRMMDIMERFLKSSSFTYSRIDGSTPIKTRQQRVDNFNSSKEQFIMVMSTKACGLGLNLSSANIVVIFEPNWNVTHDLQAMDRAHRIGQTKITKVYRLISACTVEEHTYRRQIYKQQMANMATEGKQEKRLFKHNEVFGAHLLFSYDESETVPTIDIIDRYEKKEARYKIMKTEETNPRPSTKEDRDEILELVVSKVKGECEAQSLENCVDSYCNMNSKYDLDSQVEIDKLMKASGVIYTHLNSNNFENM